MEYKKELPKKFRTWVEFYDNIKESGLDSGIYSDVIIEEYYLPERKRKEKRYLIQLVKNNALEEILSERFKREEFVSWEKGIESILKEYGLQNKSCLILGLKKIKRIILTLEGKKNERTRN